MTYLALLRGINLPGGRQIEMGTLRTILQAIGMSSVRSYLNSGNVVFETDQDRGRLTDLLERAIAERFGFEVKILVRDLAEVRSIVEALPEGWGDDDTTRCDIFFLWPEADDPFILEQMPHDPAVDDLRYTQGAVLRRVELINLTRSRLSQIVGTPVYQQMTLRSCGTARKILELMER